MNRNRTATTLLRVFAFLMLVALGASIPALADTNANAPLTDPNQGTGWDIRKNWSLRNKLGAAFLPTSAGGTDAISNGSSTGPGMVTHGPGPVQMWPVMIPTAMSSVPSQRDTGITKNLMTTFGYPLSDTQFQILSRMNDNIKMEQESDPERNMWQQTTQSSMQAGSAANSAAGMTTNQGQSAIQFQQKFLKNFTSEAGNRWLVIRDRLFIPIAVLLLLPGAVLCQVKSIIAQGSNILGETSPFEGIFRSIIAIFMIPGTLLIINYGIDVSNSIHFTIADEYTRIFGTDMYHDAQCALWRAFPVNSGNSNNNAIQPGADSTQSQGSSIFSTFEALDLDVRQYDPCAGLDNSLVADENQSQNKILARLMLNGMNVGLSGSWNILCAFQEAFLFYLFCMGPIAAALWVWPVKSLRGALGSWCEGVMILCFWSLFWNTVVLLMACFRGVSETGTVIMTALLFLSTIVTQYAFDFVGLVTQGAQQGVSNAMNAAAQAASSGAGGGGKGAAAGAGAGGHGAKGAAQHKGQTGPTSGHPGSTGSANLTANAGAAPGAKIGTAGGTGGVVRPGGTGIPVGTNGASSATGVPPAVGGGAFPLKTSGISGTPGGVGDHGLPPGAALGAITPGAPGGNTPPLTGKIDGVKGGAGDANNLASLHVNADGSLSVNNNHGGPLTAEDKKHLADQTNQLQNAMQSHDAKAVGQLMGPGASSADVAQMANHGSLSQATLDAAKNGGAGFGIGADGHSLVSATGVPSGMSTSPEALSVNGVHNMSPNGMDVGGPANGGTGMGSTMSRDGFQGQVTNLQGGQDYVGASHDQISQLAKENHIDPSQMSMLVGQNGNAEITGPNGIPLANIHDGNMYAPGVGNHATMDASGQWTATSTGTPLTHDGSMGSNFQVAGSGATFDAASGNFSANGHVMSATEFAKNPPDGVTAHMPGANGTPGGTNEFHAPATPTGNQVPEGVNPAVAFSAQAVGTEGPPGGQGQMQGLAGLAQHEGANSFSYSNQGGQLYAEANGHQIAHFDSTHQQWVASGETAHGSHAVLNQGQFDQTGAAAQHTHGQWVDSGNPTQTVAQDASGHNWHQAAAGTQPLSGYEGSYNSPVTGYGPGGGVVGGTGGTGGEYAQPAVSSAPIAGMDATHSHSFQQLAASEGLHNAQMAPDGHHVVGTDSAGHQHTIASESGGQWSAGQHNGSPDVVMNNQGQWVAPGGSTPLEAHAGANNSVSWSAQSAPEVSYNAQTHMMESGGYAAPAASVTPDMVSNIHNSHNAESLAMAGNQGQQVQNLSTQEHAGNVHTQYDAQHNLQAVGDNNQVVANYNQGEHRWEAAGSAGQVVQNQAGDWVANNSTVNALSTQEHAGQTHVQADGHGNFQAVGQNNQVVASTDGSGNWSSPQAQHMADQMGVGQTHLARDGQGHVESVTSSGSVVASYDTATAASAGHSASPGGWSAGDTNVQNMSQSMNAGPTHISQDAQGHVQAVGASGQAVANYDNSSQTWTPAQGDASVQRMASEMNAGPTHVTQNEQGQVQAVGQNGAVVANYDTTNHHWSPAQPDANVQSMASQMGAGTAHVHQNEQGQVQAVGQSGAVVANYDSSSQQWIPAQGDASVQHMASQMHAGPTHVQTDGQGHVQAVGQNGAVVANYDTTNHHWAPAQANEGVQHLANQMHAGTAHVAQNDHGQVQAIGQNGAVVANYDTTAQRWETQNGNVVQDNNQNWVANNQYVNSAQETPVQYNPQPSYSQGSVDQSQTSWSATAAPDLSYNNGTFSTTYGDNGPALSMPASNMTPDMVNYVNQNPQQVEGLQNLAHHENLQGPVQFQANDQGQVQAYASGQEIARNDGHGWVADQNPAAPAQPTVERNDGSWVNQETHHQAHTSDGHPLAAQAEPQMHSAPPTSSHPNPTIASAGMGAGAAALGAWGAMKKQNAMNTPPASPKPAAQAPETPSGPEATAQNKSLDPQTQHLREESEKKRREKLRKLLEEQGQFGGDDGTA